MWEPNWRLLCVQMQMSGEQEPGERSCRECPCGALLGQQENSSLRPESGNQGWELELCRRADDAELGWVWKTQQSVWVQVDGSDDSSSVSTGLVST